MRVLSIRVLLSALLLLPQSAIAQTPAAPAGPLALEQVLDLAEQRSEAIAIARAGIRRAEGEEIRARSGLFPQVTATVSYDRALASEFEGVFDDIDFGGDPAPDPDADPDAGDGIGDLPFGRVNTWRATLNVSQNLFDFGRIKAQRQLASAGHQTATITLDTSRAQLLFDVTQAYYNAALSDRLVAIAEATIVQASATLQQAEAAFRAGTQPEFEVLRARVARDTQNPNLIRQRVNREIALLRLKQLLDLPADADLQLADPLSEEALPPPPAFAARVASIESGIAAAAQVQATLDATTPVADRAAVKEAATTVNLREASLALTRSQRWPSLSLGTNYGRVAYPTNIVAPAFDRLNWTVGVSLQVPIYTGGRQRGDEVVAEADLEQSRVRLRQVEELAALDTRSAVAELIAARAAWEATAGTVQQANRAFELAGIRYQAGVSTQLELSDSRVLLQQAEANRAQAARDLQVARARVALLPNLPLGAGGTTGGQQQFTPPAQQAPQQQAPQTGNGQLRNASTQTGGQTLGGQQ
jgi:outer membrane protein